MSKTLINMKKYVKWMLATILIISGASVMTSCSKDKNDDPVPVQIEEPTNVKRTEFIQHTSATMKDLAENLNLNSWIAANQTNLLFNTYVLNNPYFEKNILSTFFLEALKTIKPVEEGSELEQKGFSTYATVDLSEFNHRFVMKTQEAGFDVEEADNFEVIINAINPQTQKVVPGSGKVSLIPSGDQLYKTIVSSKQMEGLALVVIIPSEFNFAISNNFTGTWVDMYSGSFNTKIFLSDGTEYIKKGDSWQFNGTVKSDIGYNMPGQKIDKTTLDFSILCDMENNKGEAAFSWDQNGRKMIELSIKESGEGNGLHNLDLTKFTSDASIVDVLATIWDGRSIDEAKLTLLDDLTTTFSVSDMAKVIEVQSANASARRNHADQNTIEKYTQQLNELMKFEITCKGVNQTIPMKLMTAQYGVDWWTMPAFKFSDEEGYVTYVDLLDKEALAYGINIIDHAVEPMKQSIIVVRQVVQYVLGLIKGFKDTDDDE